LMILHQMRCQNNEWGIKRNQLSLHGTIRLWGTEKNHIKHQSGFNFWVRRDDYNSLAIKYERTSKEYWERNYNLKKRDLWHDPEQDDLGRWKICRKKMDAFCLLTCVKLKWC
jgi:hypothetical protein